MKSLKKAIALLSLAGALTANAAPISKDKAELLLKPIKAKYEKLHQTIGFQLSQVGTASIEIDSSSGKKLCEYIHGVRITTLEKSESKIKTMQEHYMIAKNQFDEDCKKVTTVDVTNGEFDKYIFEDDFGTFSRGIDIMLENGSFDLHTLIIF